MLPRLRRTVVCRRLRRICGTSRCIWRVLTAGLYGPLCQRCPLRGALLTGRAGIRQLVCCLDRRPGLLLSGRLSLLSALGSAAGRTALILAIHVISIIAAAAQDANDPNCQPAKRER